MTEIGAKARHAHPQCPYRSTPLFFSLKPRRPLIVPVYLRMAWISYA